MKASKKHLIICALFALTMLTTACGETNTENDNTTPSDVTTSADTEATTTEAESEPKAEAPEKSDLLNDTYKSPGKNIYIDTPNYQEIEKGYTRLFIVHDKKYVAITVNKKGDVSSLSAAHESAFDKFKQNIQDDSYVNSLNITEESTETVNGIEFYKYEGTLNCGHDTIYDAYAIGCSFILDGVACNITGSVVDREQPEEMIEEIRSVVEAMIQTVRSEK